MFGMFHGGSEFSRIYSTIPRETPNNSLQNPGGETVLNDVKFHERR
jgi:hypothetical protein